ncbi:MAG TPA: VOC family protein, partial [Verrucomicrobiae bacterium]|nr:VOC family protein [Verrucomicrobiae bacterium]
MKLNPHLSFNGQCEAAFRLYERILGGQCVTMLTYGDSPTADQVPPEWRQKIAHATLTADDFVL